MADIVLVEGSNQLNVGLTPIAAVASITGASWTSTDRSYVNYWGDRKTARFYGGVVTITSDSAITGCKINVEVPDFISSVRLMTEADYQDLLAWLDEMIASSTGFALELYLARKALARTFPQIDGWREDYRWVSNHEKEFYTKIRVKADSVEYICDLVAGANNVPVAFYQLEDTGLVTVPAIISVYAEDGTLLASIQSSLPGSAVDAVIAENVFITGTTPGGIYTINAEIVIQQFTSPQVTFLKIAPDIRDATSWRKWIDGWGRFALINQQVEATYDRTDIPPGTYPMKAKAQIWRGYSYPTNAHRGVELKDDIYIVDYDLGVIGELRVV